MPNKRCWYHGGLAECGPDCDQCAAEDKEYTTPKAPRILLYAHCPNTTCNYYIGVEGDPDKGQIDDPTCAQCGQVLDWATWRQAMQEKING